MKILYMMMAMVWMAGCNAQAWGAALAGAGQGVQQATPQRQQYTPQYDNPVPTANTQVQYQLVQPSQLVMCTGNQIGSSSYVNCY